MSETPRHPDDAPDQPAAPASGLTIGRGGIGKTTTTAHLGALPSDPRLLLVDADPADDLGAEDRTTALRRAVEQAGEYELVLLDPPPHLGPIDPADPRRAR